MIFNGNYLWHFAENHTASDMTFEGHARRQIYSPEPVAYIPYNQRNYLFLFFYIFNTFYGDHSYGFIFHHKLEITTEFYYKTIKPNINLRVFSKKIF